MRRASYIFALAVVLNAIHIFIEFELDSDVLDPEDAPNASHPASQSMPLLVGLADASAIRRNPDLPLHTLSNGAVGAGMVNGRVVYDDDEDPASRVDLAELAARQHSGGNLLDSMFNMANSILGAGKWSVILLNVRVAEMRRGAHIPCCSRLGLSFNTI